MIDSWNMIWISILSKSSGGNESWGEKFGEFSLIDFLFPHNSVCRQSGIRWKGLNIVQNIDIDVNWIPFDRLKNSSSALSREMFFGSRRAWESYKINKHYCRRRRSSRVSHCWNRKHFHSFQQLSSHFYGNSQFNWINFLVHDQPLFFAVIECRLSCGYEKLSKSYANYIICERIMTNTQEREKRMKF